MPIGPRLGLSVGFPARSSEVAPPTWSTDATSGKAVPASTAEWSAFLSANGVPEFSTPDSLYLCQDLNTQLGDSVGTIHLAESGVGLSYQQAASGWTRKGVKTTNGSAGRWSSTDAALPDILTSSCLMLFYAITNATAANRDIASMGTTVSSILINFGTPPRFRVISNAGSAVSTTNDVSGAVRPFVLREVAGVSTTGFNDQEKLTPAHGAVTGKRFVLGGISLSAADTTYVYGARWDGAKAQVSDAAIKALLVAAGWTIPWT